MVKFFNLKSCKVVTQSVNEFGYALVTLQNDSGEYKTVRVHRLVAIAFIPNQDNKKEVNHINGNKLDNQLNNLEWVTSKENKKHAWDMELYKDKLEEHHQAVYTNEQIKDVCVLLEQGMSNKEIVSKTGVHKDAIAHIKRGDIWSEISENYCFNRVLKPRKSKDTIHNICKMLAEGLDPKEVQKCFTEFPLEEIRRIKRKTTHKKISDNYFS